MTDVHYKRFSQEQNKRVWTYFISVECFIGICEYVRHAARKKIANVWLRKVGIKGAARRGVRERDEYPEVSEEDDDGDDGDDDNEAYDDEEYNEQDQEYEYFAAVEELPAKRRRLDDDDEYHLAEDEDDDDEERTYFQEMEEEEAEAEVEYDTEDSSADSYDSSSSPETPTLRHSAQLTVNSPHPLRSIVTFSAGNPIYRQELSSSGEVSSSPCSSPPSSPTSPRNDRSLVHSTGIAPANSFQANTAVPPKFVSMQVQPATEPVSTDCETKEQVDWSYLHLRPNPQPLVSVDSTKFIPATAPVMPLPYYYCAPQQIPAYNYMISPNALFSNCHWLHLPHGLAADYSGYGIRARLDDCLDLTNMEDRHFDTNMFLSIPDCSHNQQ